MGSFVFQLMFMVFNLCLQLLTWFLQVVLPWAFRYTFYLSGGLLLLSLAQIQGMEPLLGFGVGAAIAYFSDQFLSSYDILIRQLVFGSTGLAAGWLLNSGFWPPLVLTTLSVFQAKRVPY